MNNIILYLYDYMAKDYMLLGKSNTVINAVKSCLSFAVRYLDGLSNTNRFKLAIDDEHEFVLDIIYNLIEKDKDAIVISSPLFGTKTWQYHINNGIDEEDRINEFVDEIFYERTIAALDTIPIYVSKK